jgi:hypothetical protein
MTLAYESAYPSSSAVTVAERAIVTARRRRIAFYYRAALGLAAVVVIALFVVTRRIPVDAPVPAMFHERFNLQCLSPDQASVLLRQEIPDGERVNISARPPLAVIEVGGSHEQIRVARSIIDHFDRSERTKCSAEVVVPKVIRIR